MASAKTTQLEGTVQAFNVSPKGSYEGLLLEAEGEIAQINFPQELAQRVAEVAPINHKVQIEAEAEEPFEHAAHPVYQMISLKNSEGKTVDANGNGHFSGTVVRLNYALHGEVNGGILDSGDFLHLKPHGASALHLKPGMKVSGKGETKPMLDGHRVIEAEEVNGVQFHKKPKPKPKKKAGH